MEGIKVCQLWGDGYRGMLSAWRKVSGNSSSVLNLVLKKKKNPFAETGALYVLEDGSFYRVRRD